ncbi:MAG: hypothetical protein ACOX8N_05915 [Christensenellales bacterium]
MPPKLTLVLRFLWYLFSRILIWAVAAALVVLSFFAAMDYMNVQILVKDGLQLRAKVIIQGDDPTALSKVFSRNFLEQDALLSSSVYRSYSIKNVDYSAKVDFQLIMPWQNAVELTVTEEIKRIDGTLAGGAEKSSALSETPPPWQNAVYRVRLVRYEDNWRIVSMTQVEALPSPTPSPTPKPAPTTTPRATIVPSPDLDSAEAMDVIED